MNPKQRAADAALDELSSGQVIGLGTGSTAEFFLAGLSAALQSGRLKDIRGVPTSIRTEARARQLRIPLVGFDQIRQIDVTVDGADEIAAGLSLIKGRGGALLREKIVAQSAARLVIIADKSKVVPTLGITGPLPIEVTQFAYEGHIRFLQSLGCTTSLRQRDDGGVFITDNSNYIVDCLFQRIDQPQSLEATLKSHAGIVETGLFLGLAKLAIIASDDGIERRNS